MGQVHFTCKLYTGVFIVFFLSKTFSIPREFLTKNFKPSKTNHNYFGIANAIGMTLFKIAH